MLRPSLFAVWIIFALLSLPAALSADTPICKTTCSPNPSSSTFGTTMTASTQPQNSRGISSPFAPKAATVKCFGPPVSKHPDTLGCSPGGGPPHCEEWFAGFLCSSLNAGSQSVNYAIPMVQLKGRNGLNLNLTLYYNSLVWVNASSDNSVTFNANRDFPAYGFRLGYGFVESQSSGGYKLIEPDGTIRQLNLVSGTEYESNEGAYVDWYSSTLTLYRPDGTQWTYQQSSTIKTVYMPVKIEDTNGNYISVVYSTAANVDPQAISTITDTLGRVITFNYNSSGELISIAGPALGGGNKTYVSFSWAQIPLNYTFNVTVNDSPTKGTLINVLTGCTYANGTGYSFIYGPSGDWGVVYEIERLSSSGKPTSSSNYNFPPYTTVVSAPPGFSQETDWDGVNQHNWTYTASFGSLSFQVTDPSGTLTTTNLSTSGLVSSVSAASGGVTLQTISYDWTKDSSGYPQVADTKTTLKDSGQESETAYSYTSFGNISEVDEYDYGPTLTRKTLYSYLTQSAYTTLHLYGLISNVYVQDASSTVVSRTDLAYDQASPISVTGAANHDDTNRGATFNTRGNLSQVTKYTKAAAGSGAISQNITYNTLGDVLTAQAECCQLEQWTFGSDTQYAYPDQLIRGSSPQFTTMFGYDFNTGLLTSSTDENGQKTTLNYDSMNRLTSSTRPDGAQIAITYNDAPAEPTSTTTSPIDANHSIVRTGTMNGIGRAIQTQTSSSDGTIGPITVQVQYDGLGRVLQTSNPFGPGESEVWTATAYDGLGRITNVTPPGNVGNFVYSYTGNKTTVTDPAGLQSGKITDALGRMVQALEPGYSGGQPAMGSVTISGSEKDKQVGQVCCQWNQVHQCIGYCPVYEYDNGTVSITVGDLTATISFGQGSTTASIASALAAAINGIEDGPVTASASGATVNLTTKVAGASTDYSLSAQITSALGSYTYSASGTALTGGTDGTGNPSISTPQLTYYYYDPLNDLTLVIQGQQSRQFTYDSLRELLSNTTPEAGTVSFSYTTWGRVSTRVDARGTTSTYSYDGLNRLTQISYNDGTTPTVGFTFDQGGSSAYANDRLTTMTDGVGSETYQYDVLGRVKLLNKTIGTTAYPIHYAFNYLSGVTSLTYPSGRVVQQLYDGIGRTSQVSSEGTNFLTLPSASGYNGASEPLSLTYGNGVSGTFTYNSRLQLASLAYSSKGSTVFGLSFNYGAADNGQIQSITDSVQSGRSVTYSRDVLGRLRSAVTTGSTSYPAWGLSWTYDRYGNRPSQSVTAGTGPMSSVTIDPTTSHITGSGYGSDTNGNISADGLNSSMTYDDQGELFSSVDQGTTTYTYDGGGHRVNKAGPNGTTIYIFSGPKVIAEYAPGASAASPSTEYVYALGTLLASISGTSTVYRIPDQLSARVFTDTNGNVVGQRGLFPFGEVWYETGIVDKWKFATYERDSESNNDYALARYYVNRLGRFSVPDPLGIASAALIAPQTLNRYAYVTNDPVDFTDPSGLFRHACIPKVPKRPKGQSFLVYVMSIGPQMDGQFQACEAGQNWEEGPFGTMSGNTIGDDIGSTPAFNPFASDTTINVDVLVVTLDPTYGDSVEYETISQTVLSSPDSPGFSQFTNLTTLMGDDGLGIYGESDMETTFFNPQSPKSLPQPFNPVCSYAPNCKPPVFSSAPTGPPPG
jgi:RHS repeat-associated protein